MFFDDQGPVPETFRRLRTLLAKAKIEHLFVGAIAANAHGFRRSTEDVDLCMPNRASEGLRVLEEAARLLYNDLPIAGELKEMRHELQRILSDCCEGTVKMALARDSEGDVLRDAKAHCQSAFRSQSRQSPLAYSQYIF